MQKSVRRYHPLLVTLHWLVALMIGGSLVSGLVLLQTTPNSDPMKPVYLRAHMTGGLVLGALMLVRLATRLSTARPAPVGSLWQTRAAKATHWALYALVFAMLMTGIGMAALGGLWPLLSGAPAPLPDFATLPPQAGHALFARALIALLALHVLATLWHAICGEKVMRRMSFGTR